jgi:hypothetical protein
MAKSGFQRIYSSWYMTHLRNVRGHIGLRIQMMRGLGSQSAMKSLFGGLALNSYLSFTKIDLVVFVRS